MKLSVLFSLAMCLAVTLNAQHQKIDSLLRILIIHKSEDSTRLNILNSLASNYANLQPDIGLKYANEAIALAQELNNMNELKRAYFFKGNNYHSKGENLLAIEEYKRSLDISERLKHKESIGLLANNIGNTYMDMSNYDSSLLYHKRSLTIFEAVKDSIKMATPINGVGTDYQNLGNYPQAINYYLKALYLHQKYGNKSQAAQVLSNVGSIYHYMLKYETSLEYQAKALHIYEQLDQKLGMIEVLTQMGLDYDKMGKSKAALDYYNKALSLSLEIENSKFIAFNLSNTGLVYASLRQYERSFENLKKAILMFKEQHNKIGLSIAYGVLGEIYVSASEAFLKKQHINPLDRFKEAIEFQEHSLAFAKEAQHAFQQTLALTRIRKVHQLEANYQGALSDYKAYVSLQDSLTNKKGTETEVSRRLLQFEYEKKEVLSKAKNDKKLALVQAEIKRQRTVRKFIIAGGIIILFSSIMIFILYKKRRDAFAKQLHAELKAQIADTEMKVMRLQMNPHFIFNSLNSISDYIIKNKPEEADAYLSKFAKVMRMTLEHSEQQAISLEDDLKTLELYMELEAKRLDNKFTYEIKVAPDIDKENTLVPPMIFQPFVENSIWHGITKKQEKGHIIIDIKKENEMLYCIIDDDGVGRQLKNLDEQNGSKGKSSLGMKITKARIDILNKLKGSNATVQLIDKPQGLSAELKLPLETIF